MDTHQKINVFKNTNFTLLFFGVLFSNIAHILFNFAMSLYVLRIAMDAFGRDQAPLVQAVYYAVGGFLLLILTPFGGALADKKNKVRIMVATDFIRGIVILGGGVLLFMTEKPSSILVLLFVVTILLNINSAFFSPASGSLLRFILKTEEMQQGASLLTGSNNLQSIIGLILGGILYVSLGIEWIFIINGVGYILSAISEIFIRYDSSLHVGGREIGIKFLLKDIKVGLRYVVSAKGIFAIVLMALFINFFFSPLFSNGMPYFIEYGLKSEGTFLFSPHLTAEHWLSVLNVTFSVSAIIGSLILAGNKQKTSQSKHLKKMLTLMSCVILTYSFVTVFYYTGHIPINPYLILTMILFLGIGLSMVFFNVPVGVLLQTKVDPTQLGKVSSLMSVLSQALIPLSSLIAGIVISQFGIVYLYLYCAIGIVFVTMWYVSNKNADKI